MAKVLCGGFELGKVGSPVVYVDGVLTMTSQTTGTVKFEYTASEIVDMISDGANVVFKIKFIDNTTFFTIVKSFDKEYKRVYTIDVANINGDIVVYDGSMIDDFDEMDLTIRPLNI